MSTIKLNVFQRSEIVRRIYPNDQISPFCSPVILRTVQKRFWLLTTLPNVLKLFLEITKRNNLVEQTASG